MSQISPRRRELAARLRQELDCSRVVARAETLSVSIAGKDVALAEIERAERAELLKQAQGGGLARLEIAGVTYVQRPKKPNRNYVRVRPGGLQALAASYNGLPFLRDHNHDLEARGGTLLESKLEKESAAGVTEYRFRQRMELVKQWAVVGVLDGTIDRFSIAFARAPGAKILCSVHQTPVFTKCDCWRGEIDEASGEFVEFEYTEAEGLEVSGVSVPAVTGTGIDSIRQLRAELSAEGLELADVASMLDVKETRPMHELATIAAVLGIALDSNVDDVASACKKLQADAAAAKDAQTLAEDKLATEIAAKNALAAAREEERLKAQSEKRDTLLVQLKKSGKVAPGGEVEAALKRTAERDFGLFEAECAERLAGPSITPAGAGTITKKGEGGPETTEVKEVLAAEPVLGSWLKSAGISEEQFEKHRGLAAYQHRQSRV